VVTGATGAGQEDALVSMKLKRRDVLAAFAVALAAGPSRSALGAVEPAWCALRSSTRWWASTSPRTGSWSTAERASCLVLNVVNDGDEVHDLAAPSGARTRRLDPGQSQRLDLGVITGHAPEVYCTLPGRKSAGMTLDVQIQPGTANAG
jgi:hypothetical protein